MIIHGEQTVEEPTCDHFGKYMLEHLKRANLTDICFENGVTREKLTYNEAIQYTVNVAVALSELGVKRGDSVAIGSEPSLHFIPTAIAVTLTGAAYTSYDFEIGIAVLQHKLNLVKPKYLICSELFWQAYKDVLKSCEYIQTIIAATDIPEIKYSLKSLTRVDVDVDSFEPKEVEGKTDTVLILYSSGTTGMPKGVQITHRACILTCLPDAERSSLQTAFMAAIGPWSVNFFSFMTYKFLGLGRKIVFSRDLSIDTVLTIIRDCRVDVLFGGPVYIREIATSGKPTEEYLDSLKMIYCRSFYLREHTVQLFKEKFPKVQDIIQAMGLTECGEPFSEIWATKLKPGSVGMVAPGVQVKVVDPETREILGPNQPGECCVKGLTIMKGYLDIDRFDYMDEDGYYKTGDLVYYDEDKYFYIIDRLTDIINRSGYKYMDEDGYHKTQELGYNDGFEQLVPLVGPAGISKYSWMKKIYVSPIEVENVLLQHPGVSDVGVVGKPDPIDQEVPIAFVVKRPGCDVTEKELVEFVAPQVSPHMQLAGVRFIPEMPRNARGKTLRRKLREMLNE